MNGRKENRAGDEKKYYGELSTEQLINYALPFDETFPRRRWVKINKLLPRLWAFYSLILQQKSFLMACEYYRNNIKSNDGTSIFKWKLFFCFTFCLYLAFVKMEIIFA